MHKKELPCLSEDMLKAMSEARAHCLASGFVSKILLVRKLIIHPLGEQAYLRTKTLPIKGSKVTSGPKKLKFILPSYTYHEKYSLHRRNRYVLVLPFPKLAQH